MPARGDHQPGAAAAARVRRRSAGSPDRESASATPRPRAWRRRLRASARSGAGGAPARRSLRREREHVARRSSAAGHEHAHDVLVGVVALEAARPAARATNASAVALDAQLEDAAGRALQLGDRPVRGDAALVHHDDVVAGVLDVGQQVRRQDQVDALVVRRGRESARASRRGPSGPCRWSARRGTAGRDRAPAPAPA